MDVNVEKRDTLRKLLRLEAKSLLRQLEKPYAVRLTALSNAIAEFDERFIQYDVIQSVVESLVDDETLDTEILIEQRFREDVFETRDCAEELLSYIEVKLPTHIINMNEKNSKKCEKLKKKTSNKSTSCVFCFKFTHASEKCYTIFNLSPFERFEQLKVAGVCFKCLDTTHCS